MRLTTMIWPRPRHHYHVFLHSPSVLLGRNRTDMTLVNPASRGIGSSPIGPPSILLSMASSSRTNCVGQEPDTTEDRFKSR